MGDVEAQKLLYNLVVFEHIAELMLAIEIIYLLVISHSYGKQQLLLRSFANWLFSTATLDCIPDVNISKRSKWPCHHHERISETSCPLLELTNQLKPCEKKQTNKWVVFFGFLVDSKHHKPSLLGFPLPSQQAHVEVS